MKIRIEGNCEILDCSTPTVKSVAIRPKGFWNENHIRVYQTTTLEDINAWEEPIINFGSGGMDGSLSSIECAKMHIEGLQLAIKIAEGWLDAPEGE